MSLAFKCCDLIGGAKDREELGVTELEKSFEILF